MASRGRVVGSNPIWGSDFFRDPSWFYHHFISHVFISFSHSLTWVVGWPHLRYALKVTARCSYEPCCQSFHSVAA